MGVVNIVGECGISKFYKNLLIGYGDTKFVGEKCIILYNTVKFKNYDKYQQKFVSKIILFFDLTSEYKIACKPIHWVKSCTCYPPLMAPANIRVWFPPGANIFF